MSIGTSLPELISSIVAASEGASEIILGNVVGSNITNILLVLGISAIISKKLKVDRELVHVDLPILVGSSILLLAMLSDGMFTRIEAVLCILGMCVYFAYVISEDKENRQEWLKTHNAQVPRSKETDWKTGAMLVISAAIIYVSARATVDSLLGLSAILKIGTDIIAVTAFALGTSLPELVVSITAAFRKDTDMAIGNIIGSNIFNSLAVMGIPGLFGTMIVPNSMLFFAVPMMLLATLLYFFITQDREVTQWEGWFLIIMYLFFVIRMLDMA